MGDLGGERSQQRQISTYAYAVALAPPAHQPGTLKKSLIQSIPMNTNRISATLAQTDREEVMQAIATIKTKLSFLTDLSPEERKALSKMGDKSQAFVTMALEIATQNQDYLPRSFDVEEMRKDVELYDQLRPILVALSQLQHLVEMTSMIAGSEAMGAALTVYRSAKVHGQGTGLEAVLNEMSQRFARKTPRKPESEEASAIEESDKAIV
jgi:hypothetical protein